MFVDIVEFLARWLADSLSSDVWFKWLAKNNKALRSNAPILQKTAKRNIVRHPAKLSKILAITKN